MLLSGVAFAQNLWIKAPDARERLGLRNGLSSDHELGSGPIKGIPNVLLI
jgi:hypothetical protein